MSAQLDSLITQCLPTLREDLQLIKASPMEDGAPGWLLYDALRNSFYRISIITFQLLERWESGQDRTLFLQQANQQGLNIDSEQLEGLLQFLQVNQLLKVDGKRGREFLLQLHNKQQQDWLSWLIHHYLFIKIPLWRPDRFLTQTLPWVSLFFNKPVLYSIRLLGIIGILFVIQQWEAFSATFLYFFTWDGLVIYGVTLLVLKSAHELGHAYSAHRRGCRVASMGVAFLVLFPVLYTDTTDAWRLRNRRDRLAIVLAGIGTELHLALLATFMWSFLPDGALRSAVFFVATTSWVTSLLINISPFMRFDGYFALSDWLGAENLQPRAFALARWKLRETLFRLGDTIPEQLSLRRTRIFISYAVGTWIYRFFLFIGIAVLVYVFAFKVLGIILFVVEILWFILLPVQKELMHWWQRRQHITMNRNSLTFLFFLVALIAGGFIPWQHSVSVPGLLEADRIVRVFPPESAQLQSVWVKKGDQVEQGQKLLVFNSPTLNKKRLQTQNQLAYQQLRRRLMAGSVNERQQLAVIAQKIVQLESKLKGLEQRIAQLTVRASITGTVPFMETLKIGQWVSRETPLLTLRGQQGLRITALVGATEIRRIQKGASAFWVADRGESSAISLNVVAIDPAAIELLPWYELASDYGGTIATRADSGQRLRPEQALYKVLLKPDNNQQPAPKQRQSGVVKIETANAESMISRFLTTASAVLIRESGF